jgi:hypothetical protein
LNSPSMIPSCVTRFVMLMAMHPNKSLRWWWCPLVFERSWTNKRKRTKL